MTNPGNINNSMMLPKNIKAPNFPRKISRKNYSTTNRSMVSKEHIGLSEPRPHLNSSSNQYRPAFNSNFSSRNSMARKYRRRLFHSGAQVTRDFDPSTVYQGIEDIDFELEEMEENIDNLPEADNEMEDEQLDGQIDQLMENNKQLLKKVNVCAEIVAKGIAKAKNLKSTRLNDPLGTKV